MSVDAASRADFAHQYCHFFDDAEFAATVQRTALRLAELPTKALVATRQAIDAAQHMSLDDALGHEAQVQRTLGAAPDYVPALVGRGQVLLATKRDAEALAAFESALAVDPALTDIARRVDVLRFRNVQQTIEAARTAAAAGRADDARVAYERALTLSPESAFLHRELAIVERARGNAELPGGGLRRLGLEIGH